MSADFWAGYLSGAIGIIIGNPLDIVKVRLQAATSRTPAALTPSPSPSSPLLPASSPTPASRLRPSAALSTGTAAPILGYGALNALLFVSYNRSEAAINGFMATRDSLWATWLAGAIGGLSTWVVSTPTELVKCRAQVSSPAASSWAVTRDIWSTGGIRGLYFGGVVTALRDSIGYGFYFWSYELATRCWPSSPDDTHNAPRVLLCGGLAGIVTWASVFPLDVIKTRLQTQPWASERDPALYSKRLGALAVAREALQQGGLSVFFRGIAVCSIRAFIVNAVQWAVYEWTMKEMGSGREPLVNPTAVVLG
ncbi:mitochondrial carrier protein [Purpureocillium lavendulum]|uniref:Mitochondrial carrier protein n=1 Tax=Purpureocillium lavendulum TaxID=1247861 RepID=A0AB34FLM0_9HYPO|nr:mitochondrial carrier protein [Purpureocillium lavendulum]